MMSLLVAHAQSEFSKSEEEARVANLVISPIFNPFYRKLEIVV